jgi:tRNA U54 and U55 pseudouridine synthase Pus10
MGAGDGRRMARGAVAMASRERGRKVPLLLKFQVDFQCHTTPCVACCMIVNKLKHGIEFS